MSKLPVSAPTDIFDVVNSHFTEQLARGKIPWHVPWKEYPKDGSNRPFRGINVWLLISLGYARNVFLTREQIIMFNASVKDSEKGHRVIASRVKEGQQSIEYHEVFNIAQIQGFPEKSLPAYSETRNPIKRCAQILVHIPKLPLIIDYGLSVFYNTKNDTVYMPVLEYNMEQYFSTLFYALVQATGHPKRLNRNSFKLLNAIDPKDYCLEELIAEFGCSLLCNYAGIEPWYLSHRQSQRVSWLKLAQKDTTLIPYAAMFADQAVEYILSHPLG